MPKKVTTEIFIEKAKVIHGDKYDYGLTEYKNASTKVKIICPTHGVFEQQSIAHLTGQGCPECGKTKNGIKKKLSLENFIERSKNNIKYKREQKFKKCKNKRELPFDFYLPEKIY